MGKTGKEIEELTGVRQNRASEIWTAYQREGESSLERKKYGRKAGSHMVLTAEEQDNIRKAVDEKIPEDFGITGKLWTLGQTRQYIGTLQKCEQQQGDTLLCLYLPVSCRSSRFLPQEVFP